MKIKIVLLPALFLTITLIGSAQSTIPSFTQYPAKVENIRNVKVNLTSHKSAKMFRTNLRNAARQGVNFAGHYILTTWGCGTNCSDSAIIDARNGRVFFPQELSAAGFDSNWCDLPDDTKWILYNANSRLLVLSGFKGGDLEQDAPCGIYYFEWTGAKFRQIKFVQKKRLTP